MPLFEVKLGECQKKILADNSIQALTEFYDYLLDNNIEVDANSDVILTALDNDADLVGDTDIWNTIVEQMTGEKDAIKFVRKK